MPKIPYGIFRKPLREEKWLLYSCSTTLVMVFVFPNTKKEIQKQATNES